MCPIFNWCGDTAVWSLKLEKIPLAKRMRMVFRHDGAPAHYSRLVTHHLNLTFPERWIGRGVHVQWPPRSPDFIPVDFCLWGWMKSEVYKEKVNTRDEFVAHYEYCCPHKARTPIRPQENYTYCCQECWKVHWSRWWDFWTLTLNCCNLLRSFT